METLKLNIIDMRAGNALRQNYIDRKEVQHNSAKDIIVPIYFENE